MKYVVYIPVTGLTPNQAEEYMKEVEEEFKKTNFFAIGDHAIFIGSIAHSYVEVVALPSK